MELDEIKAQTRATYNLASDQFDDAPLAPWAAVGRRTVELTGLAPGNRVLDVCCGSGSTAIPAAEAIGRFGTLVGVDLAEELLALANRKALDQGLTNLQFRVADFERMPFPASSCDAVICQFGIFFMADMTAAVRRMWSLVAPGGALAITTWGDRVFEPARTMFREALGDVRPDLVGGAQPSDLVASPEALRALFAAAGAEEPEIQSEGLSQRLDDPGDFWPSMVGSGTRRAIEAMGPAVASQVRERVRARITAAKVGLLESEVLYAIARRPAPPS